MNAYSVVFEEQPASRAYLLYFCLVFTVGSAASLVESLALTTAFKIGLLSQICFNLVKGLSFVSSLLFDEQGKACSAIWQFLEGLGGQMTCPEAYGLRYLISGFILIDLMLQVRTPLIL
jgi:hypothetical protein